jgi:methionyl-tRNA synthetase
VLDSISASSQKISEALEVFQLRRALNEMMDLARIGNKYFNDSAPWKWLKTDRDRCASILNTTLQLLAGLAVVMEPFLPFSAEKLWKMLNGPGSIQQQRWDAVAELRLAEDHSLGNREILFDKIEDDIIEEQIAKLRG